MERSESRGHRVLCINAGSSTLKCSLYASDAGELRAMGDSERDVDHDAGTDAGHDAGRDVLAAALAELVPDGQELPGIVAHRIVHGGPHLADHCVIDDDVMGQLRGATTFAPLHLPAELAAIEAVTRLDPEAVQVACLDTAFHRTLPPVARRLPLPRRFDDAGLRRYGFHGLSCEHVVDTVGAADLGRAVVAHLGSGASLTAVADGRSVDTSMGFTPTGGVVMGTRTGDLDPGVLVHLLRAWELDADAVEHLVTEESGLLGLSGSTSDMRELLERSRTGDETAALAVHAFCTSVRKQIGALTAVLGGLDTLVFTGGIGEHAPLVRQSVCAPLGHLGIHLDPSRNDENRPTISTDDAAVVVRVIPADENLVMARHAVRLTAPRSGQGSGPRRS